MKRRKARFGKPPAQIAAAPVATPLPLLIDNTAPAHPVSHTDGYLLLRRPLAEPAPPLNLPADVSIGPLLAQDAGRVHALLKLAYANGVGVVTDDLMEWWERLLTDSEFDRNLTFVARSGEEVVGFCLCWNSSFVKDLVVDPRWRNRGIGSALLSKAIEALRQRGFEDLALKVAIYNGAAQRLYRQFGFVQE